ncbi:MBL fold metallo-hydrolase [Pseudomonas sp. GD03860]|uniref:MBL fold metallo-hydrolase n=1 Tax=Pseudomonas TaxID=286 RepID=UPI0023633DAB|nr:MULTISPECIES: MBL fold metallo-hydrolase [Pseudomonas]MDD2060725.1 MBL fold metallo-hydrolase [Pseudomonas putida]MDH0637699.1 MBL fold metallo-hydrolase [Pseudomonas sp. GD03860]
MNQERQSLNYPCGPAPEPGSAVEVAPGVLWLRMPLPISLDHINLWAVRDGEGWAIFDTGMHTQGTLDAWQALLADDGPLGGLGVTRVFATHMHPDHIGMAGWMTENLGCELWMTFGEYMNCRVLVADCGRAAPAQGVNFYRRAGWNAKSIENYRVRFGGYGRYITPLPQGYRRLRDGDSLRIGEHDWQVVVGEGHSPEHACFHCPALQLLISGDQVLPRISSNVSVFPTEPNADPLALWLASLEKLKRQIPNDVLVLPSHNEPFKPLHARLDQLHDSQHRAVERLEQALLDGPKRAVDLFSVLFKRTIDEGLLTMATGECLANLNYLLHRGVVGVTDDEHGVAWYHSA